MIKHAIVTVGVIAILLGGLSPVGDACAISAPTNHECCAAPSPEPTSSCCSSMEAPKPGTDIGHDGGCNCIHTPPIPISVASTIAAPAPDETRSADPRTEEQLLILSPPPSSRTTEHRHGAHPPPPAYLLNCANLN